MKLKLAVCIFVAVFLSAVIFKVNQVEYIPEYDSGGKSLQVVNSENITEIKTEAETTTNDESKKDNTVRIVILNNNYITMHYSKFVAKASVLNIYFGKNFKNKKSIKKQIDIGTGSKYFKQSNVIKVEPKGEMSILKDEKNMQSYKGIFYIYKESSGLVLVNQVGMEDYVAAVISSEIGEESPKEALKAQAVCARTYIMKSQGKKYKKYNAKGDDSVSYQVYNKNVPGENSIKAANETKGTVMKYKGKLINAYYFSTSWGYTTDYRIWGIKKQKYLKETNLTTITENISNEKIFDKYIKEKPKSVEKKSPFYRWTTYLTTKQIENSIYKNMAVNVGTINRIEINKRGAGGIVAQMTIYGDKRQISIVNQNQIRKILSSYYSTIKLSDKTKRTKLSMLPSAFISIKSVYKNNKLDGIKIYGGGFGHGSGMSQSAACQMAKKEKVTRKYLQPFIMTLKLHLYSNCSFSFREEKLINFRTNKHYINQKINP